MKLTYYKQLDGIRGLAALMIMLFHFFQDVNIEDNVGYVSVIGKISHFGQTGVTLFFVLSGFLITRILIASKDAPNYFGAFYMRRSTRIFPLYYLLLIIYFAIMPHVPFSNQWSYWVYMQNFAITFKWPNLGPTHTWSLAVEEHFYLLWPLFVYYLNVNQLKKVIYAFIGVGFLTRFFLLEHDYSVFFFTFSNIDALALGAFLSIQELSGFKKKTYVIMMIAFIVPEIILWVKFGLSGNYLIQLFKLPIISMIFLGFIGYAVSSKPDALFNRIFKGKAITYAGRISYGLYIYHPLVYHFYSETALPKQFLISLLLCFVGTFAVASLSFYLFEKPILQLKKYFTYKDKAAAVKPA